MFKSTKTEILNNTEFNTLFCKVKKKVTSSDINDPVDDLEKHIQIIYANLSKYL